MTKRIVRRVSAGRKRRGAGVPTATAGRVYLASPLSTYGTERYERALESVRAKFPRASILPARDLFASNADWRERWRGIVRTLAAVVFFDDADGCIGAGTEQEITDAYRAGVPVLFLTPPPFDALMPCDGSGAVEFWPVVGGGMRQTLRVCYAISVGDAPARKGARGG